MVPQFIKLNTPVPMTPQITTDTYTLTQAEPTSTSTRPPHYLNRDPSDPNRKVCNHHSVWLGHILIFNVLFVYFGNFLHNPP